MPKLQSNPIATGADIATQRLKAKQSVPKKGDVWAQTFSSIRKDLGEKPKGWRALAAGITEGLEHSAKMSSIFDRKEDLEKYERVMDYMESANQAALQKLKVDQEKDLISAKISKFADPIYQAKMNGADRSYIDDMGRLAFSALQDEGVIPQGATFRTIDPQTMTAMYLNPDGSNGYAELTSYISEQGMDIATQRIQQMGAEAHQLSAQASYMRAQNEIDPEVKELNKKRVEVMEQRLKELGLKRIQNAKDKYIPKIDAANRVVAIADKMRPIVEKHPEVLQSVLQIVWNNKDEGLIVSGIKKLAQQATLAKHSEQAEAIAELGKYANELKIGVIKGLSQPNQSVDNIAAGTVPGSTMPPKSFLKILDDIEQKAIYEKNLYVEALNDVQSEYLGDNKNYGDKYNKMGEDYIQSEKERMNNNKVEMGSKTGGANWGYTSKNNTSEPTDDNKMASIAAKFGGRYIGPISK